MGAVDYRFFRVSAGEVSLIIDVIRRAGQPGIEIRASYWSGSQQGVARVHPAVIPGPMDLPAPDAVGPLVRSAGAVGEVSWDLAIRPGDLLVDPRGGPLRHLKAFDVQIVSRPDALFQGWIDIGGTRTHVDARGLLCHYWGRRLPESWSWVSVNVPGLIVDAVVGISRLWGLPWPRLPVGYVFVAAGGRQALRIGPLNSIVTTRGNAAAFTITASRPGERLRLDCRADAGSFNDLGEGIQQTLRGDTAIDGWAATVGRAGLEVRHTPT